MIEQLIEFIKNNPQLITYAVTLFFAIFEIVRERMKTKDAVMLIINSLKEEHKMNGHKFSEELKEKVDEIAKVQRVSKDVVEEVKTSLDKPRNGLQIGSYRGQPVYLDDVSFIGKATSAAYSAIRGIFR